MPFNEFLADRIRQTLARKKNVVEKRMFGGVGFLLNGNMLVGVWKNSLIVRLGPEQAREAQLEPHVKVFDITGRPMKGWVLVEPEGTGEERIIILTPEMIVRTKRLMTRRRPAYGLPATGDTVANLRAQWRLRPDAAFERMFALT